MNNFNFHSFITIQITPTLYLDISDETNQEKLIYESLKSENENLDITLEKKGKKLQEFSKENESLNNEFKMLKKNCFKKRNKLIF